MIESLRTTQIAFFRFATPCGFFRGSADEVQKVSVQGFVQEKIIWNHLWEHCFLVPDPCVFPPPGDHFSTPTAENRIYDWAAQAAQEKISSLHLHGSLDVINLPCVYFVPLPHYLFMEPYTILSGNPEMSMESSTSIRHNTYWLTLQANFAIVW